MAAGIVLAFYARRTCVRTSDWLTVRGLYKSGVRDLPANAGHHFNLARIDEAAGRRNAARRGYVHEWSMKNPPCNEYWWYNGAHFVICFVFVISNV